MRVRMRTPLAFARNTGFWWHSASGVRTGQGENAREGMSIGVAVKFRERGNVAWRIDCAAHDDDFCNTKKSFGIGGGSDGEISEGADGDYRDGVWRIGAQGGEDFLGCGRARRVEEMSVDRVGDIIGGEQRAPRLSWSEMWMLAGLAGC